MIAHKWHCSDFARPEPYRTGTEVTSINSENQLVCLLQMFSQLKPRILCFESDCGEIVFVGVGGSLGGLTYHTNSNDHAGKTAVPKQAFAFEEHWFVNNGEPSEIKAKYLMPNELLIAVVCQILTKGQFSKDVDWV